MATMAPDTDEPSSKLREELEDDLYAVLELLQPDSAEMEQECEESSCEEILYRAMRRNRAGFLIKVETAYPSNIELNEDGEISSYSFSWGHLSTRWIYSESMEDASMQAIEWAQNFRRKVAVKEV